MPTHYLIEGGERHLDFAKSRLRSLSAVARQAGGYARQAYYPEGAGGPVVHVRVTPTESYIIIKASGIAILSGLINQGSVIQEAGKPTMYQFYPSVEQAALEHRPRSFRNEKRLTTTADPEIDLPSAGDPYAQAGVIAPAMFTGLMSKAVSVVMGQPGRKVKYRWGVLKTHGICKDAKGAPWLIEISIENGVMATKLPLSGALGSSVIEKAIKDQLGFAPSGKSFPEPDKLDAAVAAGSVRVLLPPEALFGFYGKAPFFDDCGWAFSESGREAQNTCWSWPDDYKRGHRFKVTIGVNANGEPSSASFSEAESGYLYNWPVKECRLYFPVQSNTWDVYTFDMTKAGAFVGPRPAEGWSAPVYVFYRGDSEAVYRQSAGGSSEIATISMPDPLPNDATTTSQTETDGASSPVQGPYIGFSGPDVEADINYSIPMRTKMRYKSRPDGQYGNVQWVATAADVAADPYSAQFGGFAFYDRQTLYLETSTYTNSFIEQKTSLVISPRNRSCVFVAKSRRDYTGDVLVSRGSIAAGAVSGQSTQVYRYRYLYGADDDPHHIAYFGGAGAGSSVINVALGDGVTGNGFKFFPGTEFYDLMGNINYTSYNPAGIWPLIPDRPLDVLPALSAVSVPATDTRVKTIHAVMPQSSDPIAADANFPLFYEESPDIGGNFTKFNSGFSAFKNARFMSKGPNSIAGPDCYFYGDEPIASCLPRISWVGYS